MPRFLSALLDPADAAPDQRSEFERQAQQLRDAGDQELHAGRASSS